MGEFSRNGQTQARAAVMTVDRPMFLLKRLENVLELGRFNADARINDGKGDGLLVRALHLSCIGSSYLQRHKTLLSKFEGIGEQVLEDLLHPLRIRTKVLG